MCAVSNVAKLSTQVGCQRRRAVCHAYLLEDRAYSRPWHRSRSPKRALPAFRVVRSKGAMGGVSANPAQGDVTITITGRAQAVAPSMHLTQPAHVSSAFQKRAAKLETLNFRRKYRAARHKTKPYTAGRLPPPRRRRRRERSTPTVISNVVRRDSRKLLPSYFSLISRALHTASKNHSLRHKYLQRLTQFVYSLKTSNFSRVSLHHVRRNLNENQLFITRHETHRRTPQHS